MADLWDAPNQQAVGLDPPWAASTGGSAAEPPADQPGDGLDAMTKADLLEMAQSMGVSPANNDMTKAQLIDGIRAKQAEDA